MRQGGFNLLELTIVIGILSILLLASLPFTSSLLNKNRLQVVTTELTNAIYYARHLAFIDNKSLVLRPVVDNNWSSGVKLVQNKSDANSIILFQLPWQYPAIKVTWQGFQSKDYLIFASNLRNSAISGHFNITSSNFPEKITLTVNRLGHIQKESQL